MREIISKVIFYLWLLVLCVLFFLLNKEVRARLKHDSNVNVCVEYADDGYTVIGNLEDISGYSVDDLNKVVTLEHGFNKSSNAEMAFKYGIAFSIATLLGPVVVYVVVILVD